MVENCPATILQDQPIFSFHLRAIRDVNLVTQYHAGPSAQLSDMDLGIQGHSSQLLGSSELHHVG